MAAIFKRGNKWRVQVRLNGQKAKTKTFDTHDEAQRWARQIEGVLTSDDFVDLSEARRTTLAEALNRYLTEVTPTKKGAEIEGYRIGKWLRDPLAEKPLASIRSLDIATWRNERTQAGAAPTTVKNALTIISQVYKTASTEWGMEGLRNPVTHVRMPKNRPARERRLEPEEEERLLDACESCSHPWLYPVVVLAIETAMRQGEIIALRREHIKGSVIQLPDTHTKTSNPRSVPLSTRARAILAETPVSYDGRVFPTTKTRIGYYWEQACLKAGIEHLRFHDLRHEATSRLFEKGLNHFEVMSVTGHTTTVMLKRYTHFRAAELAGRLG
jgi:integrase